LLTNGEGKDDDEEWFVPNFGRDEYYFDALSMYLRFRDHGILPYGGGWQEQLSEHTEIIELFQVLDTNIEGPKDGNG
jgi:hypothetical protein